MTCSVEKTIAALVGMSIDSLLLLKMSHKEADQFRYRSFPYYDQLTAIYVKDRATGKDAQSTVDIIEEINTKDIATTITHEERNNYHGCEADVSLDEMDLSTTQSEQISSTLFTDVATLLGENIQTVGLEISRSIASEVLIQQRLEMVIQESA
ncbi:hypothetical protein Gotur_035448 [Gossypium turneri]